MLFSLLCGTSASAAGFTVTLSPTDPALRCGAGVTPTLSFGTPPSGTKALAIIFWDQQPSKLTGRWIVYDLPLSTKALAAGKVSLTAVAGGKAGVNEAGQQGYTAPCSAGRHDIYIDFYALKVASLGLPAGAPLQRVHAAIKANKMLEAKAHVTLTIK